jgi:hypothetical protein
MPESSNLSILRCLDRPAIFTFLVESNINDLVLTARKLLSVWVCDRHQWDHSVDQLWSKLFDVKEFFICELAGRDVGIPAYEITLGFLDISCPVHVAPGARRLGLPSTRSISQHPTSLQPR